MHPPNEPALRLLYPSPCFTDHRLVAAVEAGNVRERYRAADRSLAHYRHVQVENRSAQWCAMLVHFAGDTPTRQGRWVAPGAREHVALCYAFRREVRGKLACEARCGPHTIGLLRVYFGVRAPASVSDGWLDGAQFAAHAARPADYRFEFDIHCFVDPKACRAV